MTSNCNKYLEPTGVVLGKSTRTLGKVTLTTDGVYDSTKEYSRISLVYDPNTYISYISKQFVPAGTALSNTEYWQPLNSAILGPGQTLSGVLNMLNMLDLPEDAGFLHYNDLTNQLEWVDVEGLVEIINNSGVDFILNEPLKSINSLSTSATTAGQMLIFNGTRWRLDKITNISQAIGEPLKSIAMLGAPSGSKKIIMYNNGSWGYTDLSNMNLGSLLTDINDKNAPVPSSAGYLYYNGSNYSWNIPSSGSGSQGVTLNALLTKLNATALPTLGQKYLYWNGLSFSWNDGMRKILILSPISRIACFMSRSILSKTVFISLQSGQFATLCFFHWLGYTLTPVEMYFCFPFNVILISMEDLLLKDAFFRLLYTKDT